MRLFATYLFSRLVQFFPDGLLEIVDGRMYQTEAVIKSAIIQS